MIPHDQKIKELKADTSFLKKSMSVIRKYIFNPFASTIYSDRTKPAQTFSSKGYDPNCSFSFWLIDSYMKDLIEEPLLARLSDDSSKITLRDCGMGVWHWDVRTDVVFYSSESLQILDVESDDIFDNWERWYKVIHPEDLKGCFAFIQRCFDRETINYEHCYRVKTSSGSYKWIIDKAKVISKDAQGRPLRVVGTHTDLSFNRKIEIDMHETISGFAEHNKKLVNFTQIVSHNLNSHISNIALLLDVNDLMKGEDPNETLSNIRIVSDELNDTIAHLSDVVSVQNTIDICIKSLSLDSFLRKVLSIMSRQIEQKHVIIKNNVPNQSMVFFNAAYLESILLNLISNAIRYAEPTRNAVIKIDFFIENNKKVLTVSDNGVGIDLEKYGSVLFDIYKTFHSTIKGSGLGLHMVKNQIDSMGGKLEVTSTLGEGSMFKITFKD